MPGKCRLGYVGFLRVDLKNAWKRSVSRRIETAVGASLYGS